MTRYGVVLFHTTSSAIRGEKVAKKAGVDCNLIPVPREFSSDCGISLRFNWGDFDMIKDVLETNGVEISEIREFQG
ncbi:MAG: DUF3343 domain-containing protein [bacterium]|nr:DUF3343 domain-containing protein [bacterium]